MGGFGWTLASSGMIAVMGKASRKKKDTAASRAPRPAAYNARPFRDLPGESQWVAMAELLPAATVTVPLKAGAVEGGAREVTIVTVLPMAWPALHRADGTLLVATQGGGQSGDKSRDLASAILATAAAEPGTPLPQVPMATDATPALQDLLDLTSAPEVMVHEGFDFWVEGQELDAAGQESLARANDSVLPTAKVDGADAAYWCLIGDRPHVRAVLAEDEDEATNALARLWAAGTAALGDGTRLLGAFRAAGLLIPVWELADGTDADSVAAPLAEWKARYAAALTDAPLTPEERRAKAGILNRQVTLR